MESPESFPPNTNGMAPQKPLSHRKTCLRCKLEFSEDQVEAWKAHYVSPWHSYNEKRVISGKPAVTEEEFEKAWEEFKMRIEPKVKEKTKTYCGACKKTFGSRRAYDSHLDSKKHKDNQKHLDSISEDIAAVEVAADVAEDIEMEEVDSDEWEDDDADNPMDDNNCIFCLHHSRNFIKNFEHMSIKHSFFIPDVEYCIDIPGLMRYLGEKIASGFLCLWCNEKGRTFFSAEAARNHMTDKGHCMMKHEGITLAEYEDFYDYSSSYPDDEEGDGAEDNPDESIPDADVHTAEEYELRLPSGVTVGHRSLMRYYKQSHNPTRTVAVASSNKRRLHKVLATYRALGWTDTQQEAAARKAKDIHHMKRLQAKMHTKLGVKSNKLQKHFRIQNNF